ncbi:MAG: IS21 family transposase [Burkholderiaceae bacterium]
MRKIKTVLRLHFENKLSRRTIADTQKIGYGTVDNYLRRAQAAGLSWPLPAHVGERELGQLLFPSQPANCRDGFSEPDFFYVQNELKLVGMTKLLAWEEYRQSHPEDGYSYSQFCHRFNQWLGQQKRSMRQVHVAGEKCFVDYCGPTVAIVNGDTGEVRGAQIFVAVLGASNYTFAHASLTQTQADWIGSHVKAFEFFGGLSALVIPDNLKAGVIKADRYVPTLNESYRHWADYCGTAIVPARPYRPKDKALTSYCTSLGRLSGHKPRRRTAMASAKPLDVSNVTGRLV